jgi:hypothetical protein
VQDIPQQAWSAFGLDPQIFPIYYDLAEPFLGASGARSGAAGATAKLEKSISNFPHMLFGLRVISVYPFPGTPAQGDEVTYGLMKEWMDDEVTLQMTLAQQNVTAQAIPVRNLNGKNGINWHPFAVPFPMAGGNNIEILLTRLTSLPDLGDAPTLPEARVTLVAGVFRADMKTSPPHRVGP